MRWNRDITSAGWLIVGVVCILSGIRLMIKQEVYGKVHIAGSSPLMEGWPVFFSGLAEIFIGIFFVVWFFRKSGNE